MFNHRSTIRESRVIHNNGTIANQSQFITPSNNLVKRTVYHTPAIIQTIVDTPEYNLNPSLPRRSTVIPYNIGNNPPIKKIESAIISRPNIYQHGNYLPHPRDISKINANYPDSYVGYNNNLRVSEDLRGYKTYTNDSQRQSFKKNHIKKRGCCQRTLGYCFGNKCSWWMCLLIPVLIILVLLLLSYFINRHRVFYGYDNTSLNSPLIQDNVSITKDQSLINQQPGTLYPNSYVNQPLVPHIENRTTEVTTTDLSGNNIYNRVNSMKQSLGYVPQNGIVQPPINPQYSLPNVTPGINQIQSPQIIAPSTNSLVVNGIKMAPTIQQIQTKAMLEADRYSKQMKSLSAPLVHHKQIKSHLRHFIHW